MCLVSVFYLFLTPLHPSCRNWRVHLKVNLHLLFLPNSQTWKRLTSIRGLSPTVSLPKNHYREVSEEMRLVLLSSLGGKYILCAIFSQISRGYRWVGSWQLWMRTIQHLGSDRRRSQCRLQKAPTPITWPSICFDWIFKKNHFQWH